MSHEPPDRPKLRLIEVIPLEEAGKRSYLLQDPAGFLAAPLQVSPAALLLLACCDGRHDRATMAREFKARSGQVLEPAQIDDFVAMLDEAGVLDSPAFRQRLLAQEAEFAALSWRVAAHAGSAYEGQPEMLGCQLDDLLAAGDPDRHDAEGLFALMAPHIDLHRGGVGYGKSYALLRDLQPPDVVVILGTGHAADGRFVLCDKGFETPRGQLAGDREFLGRLEKRLSRNHRLGQLAHRQEHSIEFQALFLAHLFPAPATPAVVPILCTSFDDLMQESLRPTDHAEIGDFLAALRETVQEEERQVLLVAGADLSHVGRHFGDDRELDEAFLHTVRQRDEAALEAARSGDADRFFAAVAEHGNAHRICSVAAIYSTMFAAEATHGDPLVYDQAVDHAADLAVTYAGMAFYGGDRGLRRVTAGE